jgi:hypothetical protein
MILATRHATGDWRGGRHPTIMDKCTIAAGCRGARPHGLA